MIDQNNNLQNNFTPEIKKPRPPKKLRRWLFLIITVAIIAIGIGLVSAYTTKTGFTFSKIFVDTRNVPSISPRDNEPTGPMQDLDRTNILILGIRGETDPNGGLLSDVNMLFSQQKSTAKTALFSIPRDLYVDIPELEKKERINYAYAYGFQKYGVAGGIVYAKKTFENISGQYIDDVIVVNFNAFKDIVDILGGITIYLDKPFREDKQFAGEALIDLPAGTNQLTGEQALYYVRSRYTTSDFDRMRRQQNITMAIRQKAASLGVLTNPKKVFALLDSMGRNVRTTLDSKKIQSLIGTALSLNDKNLKRKIFDTTPEGLLYEINNGAYHLLPIGNNFDKIKQTFKDIFKSNE